MFPGKTSDPEVTDYCYAELQEDVFGDEVSVGGAEASYAFTYRILEENKLTVGERDRFLAQVKQGAEDALNQALRDGSRQLDKAAFQKALEQAGKAAGTPNIAFTGCTVESCEVYR